ncbi:hypothetical protein LU699_14725 [Luteimonas fraxinea]|uniref:Uncharacterized protein n=1 Tax=Luteimonas fraxinea TaxID=2901869 RepID=A0ABS8UEL6_9GAMM|nr:hypothetical protein [Luteimonas fraxinea]MCD9097186.1 hypothetical protein [Luteimonas fraxinea]MCD9126549.1 hypothetical protein [Luteimonas fraxinea]UHH09519.1 hypothetical protein LU699_14725 [Luteimonas fraxinea]
MTQAHTTDTTRGPLEEKRTPDGPKTPGESSEKRDQDQRNDPESMPGALEGNPTRRSGEGTPDNPGNRKRD